MGTLHNNRTRTKSRKYNRARIKLMLVGIAALLVLVLGIAMCFLLRGGEQPETPDTPVTDTPDVQATSAVSFTLPQSFVDSNTSAEYIVLYDATAGKTLYSKNADQRCYPASTTKLLTALVTLQYADENTVFTVGDEIDLIDPQSSVAYLRKGSRLDLQTILEAILLPSGNDAAYAAAANVGRIIAGDDTLSAKAAVSKFCEKMNETAKTLGATDSHFVNPDGIHNENHYTTAADMALIAKAALDKPLIAKVVGQEKVVRSFLSGESGVTWYNTNSLLRTDSRFLFEGATGMKTGHTNEAGYCLIASAERNGVKLIAVVMNAHTADGRFEDASGLFTVCYDSMG